MTHRIPVARSSVPTSLTLLWGSLGGGLGLLCGSAVAATAWGAAAWASPGTSSLAHLLALQANPFVLAADTLPLVGAVNGAVTLALGAACAWNSARSRTLQERLAETEPPLPDIQDGLLLTSASGRILAMNLALERMCGMSARQLVGTAVDALLPGVGAEDQEGARWRRTSRGEVLGHSWVMDACHADGGSFTAEVSYTAVPHPEGRRVLYAIRDLSQDFASTEALARKDAELAAARHEAGEARRARSALYSTLSHALLTPLNAVIGYGELVVEELEDGREPGVVDDVTRIVASGQRLRTLIQGLLDLGRVEAGREQAFLEWFAVRELFDSTVEACRPHAEANGNTLVVCAELPPLHAHLDRSKLHHILAVLLENACLFTERGRIVVEASADPASGSLVFGIADTGEGIPLVHRHRVFEAFPDLTEPAPRLAGGHSVGLALARRYAELMGGELELRDSGGAGCAFRLVLPLDATQALFGEDALDGDSSDGVLVLTEAEQSGGEDAYHHPPVPLRLQNIPTPSEEEAGRVTRGARPKRSRRRTLLRRLSVPPQVSPVPPASGAVHRGRALLVAPDDALRNATAADLAADGWWVTGCADAAEAMHLVRARRPEVIVVDVLRGAPDLWELRRLANHELLVGIPIVAVAFGEGTPLVLPIADLVGGPTDRAQLRATLERFPPAIGGRMLLVADDRDGASVTRATAERAGWSVTEGDPARLEEEGSHFDLVVVELYADGFRGLEALVTLSQCPAWTAVPVVLVVPRELSAAQPASLRAWLDSDLRPVPPAPVTLREACRRFGAPEPERVG
ncbi:MAG: PAS domain S-box protein [Alphaproteobacteria bacterium]|nr:PAS domain S-box protein [Alphaproteobacteria bacterium]